MSDSNKRRPAVKMHAGEVDNDHSLASGLISTQFPQWAKLLIEPVRSAGTDNAIFRLGDDMAVRLPRTQGAVAQVDKEQQWLPRLAPFLPLAIPVPIAKGRPADKYPWDWSVYRWLPGRNATVESIANPVRAATDLGRFVAALQRIDPTGGPAPGPHNFFRGVPLVKRNDATRAAIASLNSTLDGDAALAAWDQALEAPVWPGAPVWIHGDLQPGNLLVVEGQLSAVIDFGGLGVGDPACDLIVAWSFLSAETRDIFRAILKVDDATWTRGRGWALSFGLIALPYYQSSNPDLAGIARHTIDEVLGDYEHAG